MLKSSSSLVTMFSVETESGVKKRPSCHFEKHCWKSYWRKPLFNFTFLYHRNCKQFCYILQCSHWNKETYIHNFHVSGISNTLCKLSLLWNFHSTNLDNHSFSKSFLWLWIPFYETVTCNIMKHSQWKLVLKPVTHCIYIENQTLLWGL